MNPTVALLAAEWLSFLRYPSSLVMLIPIVAILVTGILGIVKLLLRHRERMAMIERGLHPDYPPEQDDVPNRP
jgi:hypothetical protein